MKTFDILLLIEHCINLHFIRLIMDSSLKLQLEMETGLMYAYLLLIHCFRDA